MPRASTKPTGKSRHDPLHIQLGQDAVHQKFGKISEPGKRKKSGKSGLDEEGEVALDARTSQRIFELAKDQQNELEMPEDDDEPEPELDPKLFAHRSAAAEAIGDEEDDASDLSSIYEDAEDEFQIDSGDLKTLDNLLPRNAGERKTLADIIFAKLDSGETSNAAVIQKVQQIDKSKPDPSLGLDPKVVEVYTKVGLFLSKYKSGPLPKIFKVIPSLPAWARILALTSPENWTPHACRAATKIFISNMKPPQAQVFLEVVLLDAMREDIAQNKKLNPQYYEALKRAIYKPSAFFKGIIFPMLDSGCTLKEATIIASILAKNKVPVLHSSAALMRIADMDYAGPNSLFIRVLIDKKYELPFRVVDALVYHFIRLSNTYKAKLGAADKLPVLWHQSLLAFSQRYAPDLTPDQKDALLDVIRVNPHPQIGPEIRRELVNSVIRGEPRPEVGDGDVSMA